jgi:hypothetical protein
MGKIELRDFDGNLEALLALRRDPFIEEYGNETWIDLYKPEVARYIFAEIPDPRFLVGAYHGQKLVGFIANVPRSYHFNQQAYVGIVSTMLVAHQDYRGAAVYLILECLRRNREFGADFALFNLEKGHRSWDLFNKYLKSRFRIEKLKTMNAIVRAVDFGLLTKSQDIPHPLTIPLKILGLHKHIKHPPVSGKVRPYQETDLVEIYRMIERYSDHKCLVRIFNQESLARKLSTEGITSTVVYERDGATAGFINFSIHDFVNRQGTHRWAWFDFLYWEGLTRKEKKALLSGLWHASQDQGCIGIMEWNKNYYQKIPLYQARFIPYPRFIDMNAWVFNPKLSFQGVNKIFEQVI